MVLNQLKMQNTSIIDYESMYNRLSTKLGSFLCFLDHHRTCCTRTNLPEPVPPLTLRNGASRTNTHRVWRRAALRTQGTTIYIPAQQWHSTSTRLHAEHIFIITGNSNSLRLSTTTTMSVGISNNLQESLNIASQSFEILTRLCMWIHSKKGVIKKVKKLIWSLCISNLECIQYAWVAWMSKYRIQGTHGWRN